ncbi:MAG: SHOCT domain-containing protein, partial [Burkholderiaceae bacterium]|nr:SHOCT domain-containing protein [Burkholderiaceae bacterium]
PGANEEVRTKELLDLVKLYEKGYLTEEEFKKQKAKLLGE